MPRGGKRKGAGRPPDYIRERLKDIAHHPKAMKFLERAVFGENEDVRLNSKGEVVKMPPSAIVRAQIWESVHDRGYGKPVSVMELPDGADVAGFVVLLPTKEVGKKGEASDGKGA